MTAQNIYQYRSFRSQDRATPYKQLYRDFSVNTPLPIRVMASDTWPVQDRGRLAISAELVARGYSALLPEHSVQAALEFLLEQVSEEATVRTIQFANSHLREVAAEVTEMTLPSGQSMKAAFLVNKSLEAGTKLYARVPVNEQKPVVEDEEGKANG